MTFQRMIVCLALLTLAGPLAAEESPEPAGGAEASSKADPPSLKAATDAVYRGDHVEAARMLSDIISEHRDDPNYFVVHALSRIIAGPGRERTAIVALQTSRRFRKSAPRVNAMLALCYRAMGDDEESRKHFKLAERHLADDPLFGLARASDLLSRRQWDQADALLAKLADGGGGVAAEAKARRRELNAFREEHGQRERELNAEVQKLQKQRSEFEEQKDQKEEAYAQAKTEREDLKRRYQARRADAYEAYQNQIELIQDAYDDAMDEADDASGATRERLERDARKWRADQMAKAKESLDRAYAKIDRQFAPAVKANTRKLDQLERDARNLRKDLRALEPKEARLSRQLQALTDIEPFDLDAYWRQVALWLARQPLERPDLPGPSPAPQTPAPEAAPQQETNPPAARLTPLPPGEAG